MASESRKNMKRTQDARLNDAATRRLLRLLHLAARISKERGVSVEKLCEPTAIPEAAKANGESAEGSKKRNQEAAP